MKSLFIFFFTVVCLFPQSSKMSKIKTKIKEKVEEKRANEKLLKSSGDSNSSKVASASFEFTDEEFKRSYEFMPNDDIPWNATILVYDGRFESTPYNPDRDIKIINKRLGQHYSEFPYQNEKFYNDYNGKKFFSRFNYNYGYDNTDKVELNDYNIFFVYDNASLRLNYKILSNDFGDEAIDFTFLTASPGFFYSIESIQTGINLYAGFASFAIKSEYSQSFSGLNIGLESLSMLGKNLSLQVKAENISVKDKVDDDNFFMNFFQAEIDFGYHFDVMKISIGYQVQKFNALGLKGDDRFLRQPYLGVHLFY